MYFVDLRWFNLFLFLFWGLKLFCHFFLILCFCHYIFYFLWVVISLDFILVINGVVSQADCWMSIANFWTYSISSLDLSITLRLILFSNFFLWTSSSQLVCSRGLNFVLVLIIVSLSIKAIGKWSESISNTSLKPMKRNDKFLNTKNSIKSGTLFQSVGQYVGFPVVCTSHYSF